MSAANRYERLKRPRENVLRQAREAARLTIPGLIPDEGSTDPHDISEQPYTSIGARGVNNISAKLLLTMFPPERPFFVLDVDPNVKAELGGKAGEVEAALAAVSHQAMVALEMSASRTLWMEALRHLVVAGNVLVYHPDDGSISRMWRIDQYVVKRNAKGELIEAVIREEQYPSEMDKRAWPLLGDDAPKEGEEQKDSKEEKKVAIYTHIMREGDQLIHYQELYGQEVPGTRGSAKADEAGWQALRWQAVPGSDYGRSYVSEYAGDFYTHEEANQAILKFAAAAARIIHFVDPNAGIDVEELAEAESGDFLTGFIDRVQTLQLDKQADFGVVLQATQMVERRLSQAFLLASNTIRNAERVTAEEIRAIAQELEDALGGTYTVLSAEVQRPYAKRLLKIVSKSGKAPALPDSVTPVIVTGFSALGQNHEVAAIRDWLFALKEAFGPQYVGQAVDAQAVGLRLGVGLGVVNVRELLKDPEAMAQEQNTAMASEMISKAAGPVAKGVMDGVNQGTIDVPEAA
jgi:hypothetical protein